MDKLTSRFQAALADAQSLCAGRDHQFIEPAHVLLALLDSQGGGIAPLLLKAGGDVSRLRSLLGEALDRLPKVTIRPTVEYDAKVHTLSGPSLGSVVGVAGVDEGASVTLAFRALDGYNVAVGLADARAYRMIVATSLDGVPLGLGGLGPLWAVYDADRLVACKDKPLKERFALCPWGLYSIEVVPT